MPVVFGNCEFTGSSVIPEKPGVGNRWFSAYDAGGIHAQKQCIPAADFPDGQTFSAFIVILSMTGPISQFSD